MVLMRKFRLFLPVGSCATLLAGMLLFFPTGSTADSVVTVNARENRGAWEGWGCSLSWWGNGIGGTAYEHLYSDLFFTQNSVPFMGKPLPGLGLNIVRYNVGGSSPVAVGAAVEKVPATLPWYKKMDGYWINWYSTDPNSTSWDWSRDRGQRSILQAALARGVNHVELFANAPMWWMTDKKSPDGGALQSWNRRDFARYIAAVSKHASDRWGVPVDDVEMFNEPSAGWWNYPMGQEGCNIPVVEQKEVLGDLREELNARGLGSVGISASDENAISEALTTNQYFQGQTVSVSGQPKTVASLVSKVNVHGYSGLAPWTDNTARQALRQAVGTKRLWMSEFGDGEGSGKVLARQIIDDLTYLRPTAWIYWQPVEPYSGWGFVNGNYATSAAMPDRGAPTWVYTKYYVMAQFTRFLRPGAQILGCSDPNSVCAYDSSHRRYILITLNSGDAQAIHCDLSGLPALAPNASVTVTNMSGPKTFKPSQIAVRHNSFTLNAEANSIYSLTFNLAPRVKVHQ